MVPQLDGIAPHPPSLERAALGAPWSGHVAALCAAAERAIATPEQIRRRARWFLAWMAGLELSPRGGVVREPSWAAFRAATWHGHPGGGVAPRWRRSGTKRAPSSSSPIAS
jgi:hypothetical protein